ncbi:MAG: ATP-binding protein [Bacillota bacterium]
MDQGYTFQLENRQKDIKKYLILILMLVSLFLIFKVNMENKTDLLYTHFFYLPIILAGLWFGSLSLLVAAILGMLHIYSNFLVTGCVLPAPLIRAVFFLFVAFIIFLVSGKGNIINVSVRQEIKSSWARQQVGYLATAFGHEIRNPITTIRGYLQLFKSYKEFSPYRETFEIIIKDIDHADKIIQHCLFLSSEKHLDLKTTNLENIWNSIEENINTAIKSAGIVLKKNFRTVSDLSLDEREIRQLMLNLVYNGIESMPLGGRLDVQIFAENNGIIFAVSDQGEGMPDHILAYLGSPFQTTKDAHLGLGLAVCFSIAARHNAQINIRTGKSGTTVFIRFLIKKKMLNNIRQKFFNMI